MKSNAYKEFEELMQNSITGKDVIENAEVIEKTLSMLKEAYDNDDYQNMTISLETESGPITNIEIYKDDLETMVYQVGDRSPHLVTRKGSLNTKSLITDLKTELKRHMNDVLFFNCGITNDQIMEENIDLEDISDEIEQEELEDILEKEYAEINKEPETKENNEVLNEAPEEELEQTNDQEILEDQMPNNNLDIQEQEQVIDAREIGPDEGMEYEPINDSDNEINSENETSIREHNATEMINANVDLNNIFRLEQALLKEDNDYVLTETEPGEYRLTNNNLPAKFHVLISQHGVIVPTNSPVRPDDLELFNKMCGDAKIAVINEYELEAKEAQYNSKTLAGRPTYEYLERLVEEFQERVERNDTSETEPTEVTYSFKDGDGKDFFEISIKLVGIIEGSDRDINAELSCRFSEEYGGAEEKTNINTIELQNSDIKESNENKMLISFADRLLTDELECKNSGKKKITYELRDNNGVIEEVDQKSRENVVISDKATFGQKIDDLSNDIRNIVEQNIIPTINVTQKSLKTMNNVRKGFIRTYSDGLMSGVELMSGVKDFKEGWKNGFSVEKLENALSSMKRAELKNEVDRVLQGEGYNRDIIPSLPKEEKDRINRLISDTKEKFLEQNMPNIYQQHYIGNSLGKAIYNLEKNYVSLCSNPDRNEYQVAKAKQEIYIARNYLTKDLNEFERCAVSVRIKAEKVIDELNKLKQKLKANTIEKIDIDRTGRVVRDFRDHLQHLSKMIKDKVVSLQRDGKTNMYNMYKGTMNKTIGNIKTAINNIKRNERAVVSNEDIERRELAKLIHDKEEQLSVTEFIKKYETHILYEELERAKEDSLKAPEGSKEREEYKRREKLKERIDEMALGVQRVKNEVLKDDHMTKEEAVEKIAEKLRNYEVSFNGREEINDTTLYEDLDSFKKGTYQEIAKNVVANYPDFKNKSYEVVKDERSMEENIRTDDAR